MSDTEKDYLVAKDADCHFIGVSYGWQINSNDVRFPVANFVDELRSILLTFCKDIKADYEIYDKKH
ncbi:MAG: hypothetical protein QXG00_05235 [Candidatus Woesearchaeota archaeon]